ncbi:MAG: hypothetical protein GY803_20670 [Chloroflexi bacterium]|nr:hypothetical protein [Chloroflexota bacterium]
MDTVDTALERVHETLAKARNALELAEIEVEAAMARLNDMRQIAKNWRIYATDVNGVAVDDATEAE